MALLSFEVVNEFERFLSGYSFVLSGFQRGLEVFRYFWLRFWSTSMVAPGPPSAQMRRSSCRVIWRGPRASGESAKAFRKRLIRLKRAFSTPKKGNYKLGGF